MKKLLTAFAIIALTAVPALAKSKIQATRANADAAYASSDVTHAAPGGWVIASDGQVGADPDQTVQLSLRRDAPTGGSQ